MPNEAVPKDVLAGGNAKAFTKEKFFDVYNLVTSLQHVAIQPFNEQLMMNDVFQNFLSQAEDYYIKRSSVSGTTVAMLKFHTVEYGDAAMLSMYQSFADGHIKVFHPKLDDDDLPNVLEQRRHDIDCFMNSFHGPSEKLVERCVVLEDMPQCDQEELYAQFGTAINILDFTCDETISDLVVLEMRNKEEALAFVKEKKGSTFKNTPICVSQLEPRLKLLSFKYNTHVTSKQTVHSFLSDHERLAKVQEILVLDEERQVLENKVDLIGLQKFYRYKEISKTYDELRRALFSDAKRRVDKDLALPEDSIDMTDRQRKAISGKGVIVKQSFNGSSDASPLGQKRLQLSQGDGPPAKRPMPALLSAPPMRGGFRGRGGGPNGVGMRGRGRGMTPSFAAGRGSGAPSANEQMFMKRLGEMIQELTEEVRAQGQDPTVKPQLDRIHGLGLRAPPDEFQGNLVISGMNKRIQELEIMLGREPNQVVEQIQADLAREGGSVAGRGRGMGGGAFGRGRGAAAMAPLYQSFEDNAEDDDAADVEASLESSTSYGGGGSFSNRFSGMQQQRGGGQTRRPMRARGFSRGGYDRGGARGSSRGAAFGGQRGSRGGPRGAFGQRGGGFGGRGAPRSRAPRGRGGFPRGRGGY